MAGGQRIDDHSFWAGKGGKGSVFPDGGAKTKQESSDGHSGSLSTYDDTSERIKSMQEKNGKMAKSRPLKDTFRN